MAGSGAARRAVRVGVISDTHGVLPDVVLQAFAGVDAIVHVGDVEGEGGGHRRILEELRAISPVTAVRGNCDDSGEEALLPAVANVRIGGVRFLIGHKKQELLASVDPVRAAVAVVVTGHTHKSHVEEVDGVLYLNPGTAGDDRGHGRSVAVVRIAEGRARARIVRL